MDRKHWRLKTRHDDGFYAENANLKQQWIPYMTCYGIQYPISYITLATNISLSLPFTYRNKKNY